jgi:hypothetical protein
VVVDMLLEVAENVRLVAEKEVRIGSEGRHDEEKVEENETLGGLPLRQIRRPSVIGICGLQSGHLMFSQSRCCPPSLLTSARSYFELRRLEEV